MKNNAPLVDGVIIQKEDNPQCRNTGIIRAIILVVFLLAVSAAVVAAIMIEKKSRLQQDWPQYVDHCQQPSHQKRQPWNLTQSVGEILCLL